MPRNKRWVVPVDGASPITLTIQGDAVVMHVAGREIVMREEAAQVGLALLEAAKESGPARAAERMTKAREEER